MTGTGKLRRWIQSPPLKEAGVPTRREHVAPDPYRACGSVGDQLLARGHDNRAGWAVSVSRGGAGVRDAGTRLRNPRSRNLRWESAGWKGKPHAQGNRRCSPFNRQCSRHGGQPAVPCARSSFQRSLRLGAPAQLTHGVRPPRSTTGPRTCSCVSAECQEWSGTGATGPVGRHRSLPSRGVGVVRRHPFVRMPDSLVDGRCSPRFRRRVGAAELRPWKRCGVPQV